MSTGFLFVYVITQDPHDIDYHSKDPRTGDNHLKLRKEDDWYCFLPTRDFEAGDIEFIDTGVSQNVAKLGGKDQNSMSWMIVSPRPELINKLVRQTHEWHPLEGLVRYWYTFLRKYKRVPHPGGGALPIMTHTGRFQPKGVPQLIRLQA